MRAYLRDVTTLELSVEKCDGCGMCLRVCPHAVFTRTGGKANIVNRDACMECGACALNCPQGAIFVRRGVGCAQAVLIGTLRNTEPSCGCGEDSSCCS